MEVKQGMGGGGERKVNTGTNWQKVLTPVVGAIVLIIGGVVAFLLSEPATKYLRTSIIRDLPNRPEVQYVVAFGIFIVLLMFLFIIYAAIAPKPKATTNEAALDKEKKEKLAEQARAKRRQVEMKQRMKQANRNKKE
jgi:hypothetical protein